MDTAPGCNQGCACTVTCGLQPGGAIQGMVSPGLASIKALIVRMSLAPGNGCINALQGLYDGHM